MIETTIQLQVPANTHIGSLSEIFVCSLIAWIISLQERLNEERGKYFLINREKGIQFLSEVQFLFRKIARKRDARQAIEIVLVICIIGSAQSPFRFAHTHMHAP